MHLNLHRIVCPLSNLLSINSRQRVKECRACSVIAMYLHIEVNWHFKFIKFMLMMMTSRERDDDVGECFRRCVWVCWACYSISSNCHSHKMGCKHWQQSGIESDWGGWKVEPFDHPHLGEMGC